LWIGNREYSKSINSTSAPSLKSFVRGEPIFMRDWDDKFIDVPEVDEQNQPTLDRGEMTAILQEAEEPYCTLYALLAGCGPMRAGEALGLDIRSIHEDWYGTCPVS
jgi:integrase